MWPSAIKYSNKANRKDFGEYVLPPTKKEENTTEAKCNLFVQAIDARFLGPPRP